MRALVYLAAPWGGPLIHKIGISQNPAERVRVLWAPGFRARPWLIDTWEVEYPYYVEQDAHYLLRHHRVEGEWFSVTEAHARRAITLATCRVNRHRKRYMIAADPDAAKLLTNAEPEKDWFNPIFSAEEVATKWEVGVRTLYNLFGARGTPPFGARVKGRRR